MTLISSAAKPNSLAVDHDHELMTHDDQLEFELPGTVPGTGTGYAIESCAILHLAEHTIEI